ncbi:MAG: sulfotransferase [Anaerolineae bacterium]|nr:sulfotransferase [Anaerolineae bacterium]MCB9107510.1 sulfotransferase [Anaerolineales bacterium]
MFKLRASNPSNTIILAGSGRSGTTWLGNIIAANPNVRVFFEPFDYRQVPEATCLPLIAYARPDEEYPDREAFMRAVLSGRVENSWINQQGKRWWATVRFIKAIRANLMLGWIDRKFQPKIVFTTRHPCAVILSRIKLNWQSHLDVFLEQSDLVEDYLQPYLDIIHNAQTPVQKEAVMWCIENLIPLRQLPHHNWVFCTYEEFYRHTETEAKRVLNAIGIRKSWFTQRAIQKVSMVTRPDSAILNGQDPLSAWKKQLSKQDIDAILTIVDRFNITLYDSDITPHKTSLLKETHQGIAA